MRVPGGASLADATTCGVWGSSFTPDACIPGSRATKPCSGFMKALARGLPAQVQAQGWAPPGKGLESMAPTDGPADATGTANPQDRPETTGHEKLAWRPS